MKKDTKELLNDTYNTIVSIVTSKNNLITVKYNVSNFNYRPSCILDLFSRYKLLFKYFENVGYIYLSKEEITEVYNQYKEFIKFILKKPITESGFTSTYKNNLITISMLRYYNKKLDEYKTCIIQDEYISKKFLIKLRNKFTYLINSVINDICEKNINYKIYMTYICNFYKVFGYIDIFYISDHIILYKLDTKNKFNELLSPYEFKRQFKNEINTLCKYISVIKFIETLLIGDKYED
jgi:hypothetical protein